MSDPSLLLKIADLSSDEEEEDDLSHIPEALRGHLPQKGLNDSQKANEDEPLPQVMNESVPDMFLPKKKIASVTNDSEVYVEKNTGLKLKGRAVGLDMLCEDFGFESIPSLAKNIESAKKNNNFIVIGVIVMKSGTERSKNGNKFMKFRLHDLDGGSVLLMAFDSAYEALWKVDVGQAIAVVRPNVLPPNNTNGSINIAITCSQSSYLRVLGRSLDLGFCKGTKKAGGTCDAPVNTTKGSGYCTYHLSQAKMVANRNVAQSTKSLSSTTTTNLNLLPNHHPNMREVARSTALTPARRVPPQQLSQSQPSQSPPPKAQPSQHDKLLLAQLGASPGVATRSRMLPERTLNGANLKRSRTDAPPSKNPPKFPGCLAPIEELRAFEHLYNEWLKSGANTTGEREAKRARPSVKPPQPNKAQIDANRQHSVAAIEAAKKKAEAPKLQKIPKPAKTPIPKLSQQQAMEAKLREKEEHDALMYERRKEMQERDAKRRLIAASSYRDVNTMLQPMEVLEAKRKALTTPAPMAHTPSQEATKQVSSQAPASKFQQQFAGASTRPDLPEHLTKTADIEKFERTSDLLGALDRKDQIIDEMSAVKETKTNAYKCMSCCIYYLKKENPCCKAGHSMKWHENISKKFWECASCHQRDFTLGPATLPKKSCNCITPRWEPAGMHRGAREVQMTRMSATGTDDYLLNPYA